MNNINEILLEYSGKEIIVVMDNDKKPWFNAVQIATILNYTKQRQAINQLVDKDYMKQLQNIVIDIKIYKNAQPHALFINEFGLYALLLRSHRKEAKKFFKWIVEIVIPNIRQNGYYEADTQTNKKIKELEIMIEKLYEENLVLKNDKKEISNDKGKYIYVIKNPETFNSLSLDENKVEEIKIGKSGKYKKRISVHNSSHSHNVIILYRVRVNNNNVVEQCVKSLLNKQAINNKEFFNISLKGAINTINKCIKLTKSKKISEDKYFLDMIKNNKLSRNINLNVEIIFNNDKKSLQGGSYINNNKSYDDYILIQKLYDKVFINNTFTDVINI
jgi:prophage antirepressor-like protein